MPNQYSALGEHLLHLVILLGSSMGSQGARMAAPVMSTTQPEAIQNPRPRRFLIAAPWT